MNAAGGYRSNTAGAYLASARQRRNIDVRLESQVDRLVIEDGHAVAVLYRHAGRDRRVDVRREIVLSAGAFNSPKLLMLSGIGPADELRAHGINVVQDLPGVGRNLMDHQISTVQMECPRPVSLAKHLSLFAQGSGALRWLFRKDGVLASNHFECGAFIRSGAGIRFPDIQLYLFPIAVKEGSKDFLRQHGFQVQLSPQRTQSRGHVRLRSGNPAEPPRILFNFMSAEQDWVEMRKAFRLAREVLAQPAMDAYRGRELSPGPEVQSDAQLNDYIRDHMHSSYHACGTCKMGTDPMAVVDPHCRVRGVEGLRIVDASIMPMIPSCNLNSPTMMIGRKGLRPYSRPRARAREPRLLRRRELENPAASGRAPAARRLTASADYSAAVLWLVSRLTSSALARSVESVMWRCIKVTAAFLSLRSTASRIRICSWCG